MMISKDIFILSESSATNMARIRCRSNKETKNPNRKKLLPDMWVTHYQFNRTGRTRSSYYLNVRTRQKFYSKKAFYKHFRSIRMASPNEMWINRETAEKEKDQMCSRCKEIGHNCITCPYPIIYKTNPFAGTRVHRCSRCHHFGHNVRTCPRPVSTSYVH